MLDYPCRVLLIEDEPEDVNTIQNILSNVKSAFFQRGFELVSRETLTEAKQILLEREFDVILLDLMLPDSRHINSLQELQELVANVPIIVQTALEDEIVAVKALELGARGYLPKVASDRNLLLYAIRSAIERQRQLANVEQLQQQREVDLLKNLLLDSDFKSYDYLLQEMPDVFQELQERYCHILDRFVEQKIYKVEYKLSNQINIFIEQLGYLQATPRDLLDLHTAVLKQKQSQSVKNIKALTIEGRYLVLELMGRLVAYYRRYYIGLNKLNLIKNNPECPQAERRDVR